MKKLLLVFMMTMGLVLLSGCNLFPTSETTTKEETTTKATTEKTTQGTTTQETTTDNQATLNFVEMYMNTLTKIKDSDGYTYTYDYKVLVSGSTSLTTTLIAVDNQQKNMILTSTVKQTLNGNTSTEEGDAIYISQVGDKMFTYTKLEEDYIANEMAEEDVFLVDNTDLITGINVNDLEVVRLENNKYSLNIPLSQMDGDSIALQDVFKSFGMDVTSAIDVTLPITYIFNPETQLLSSIEVDMTSFIIELYKVLFPGVNFGKVEMKLNVIINDIGGISVENPYLNSAIYDDAPNEIGTYLYPEFGLEEINCQFEYLFDTDVYQINVTEAGKYILKFTEENIPVQLQLIDQEGNLLINATMDYLYYDLETQNPVAYDLSEGIYYISATNYSETPFTTSPTITFEKVVEDDYSDTFVDESTYPIKQVSESSEIVGHINYVGDVDVIKLNRTYQDLIHLEVSYTDLFLLAKVTEDGFFEYETIDMSNGIYDIYLNNQYAGYDYLIFSSNEQEGSYQVKLTYFNASTDEGESVQEGNVKTVSIDQMIKGAFHQTDKKDAYQFTITEPGYYNFTNGVYNLEQGSYNSIRVNLYNSNKELIDWVNGRSTFELESGTYYLEVIYEYGISCLYSIDIKQAMDDFDIKDITLTDSNQIPVSINYGNDMDTFRFAITEETFYKINYSTNDYFQTQVTFKDVNGNIVYQGAFEKGYYIADDLYVHMIPGEYTLEVSNRLWGTYTILLDKITTVTDDYPSATSDESKMGVLGLGNNTITLDYRVDYDMYLFEVQTAGEYFFKHDFYSRYSYNYAGYVYFTDESGTIQKLDLQKTNFTLNPGKYYFSFHSNEASVHHLEIEFYDPTTADESEVTYINLLSDTTPTYKGQINEINDEDVYQITLLEDGLVQLNIDAFYYSFKFKLIDANNQVLVLNEKPNHYTRDGFEYWSTQINVDLKAGVYTLIIQDTLNGQYVYNINFAHNTLVHDDYSNTITGDNVGTLVLGQNTFRIDYSTDVDVFMITLETDGGYYFTFEEYMDFIGVYDTDNNLRVSQTNFRGFLPSLRAGTYYIKVYDGQLSDYTMNIVRDRDYIN